MRRVGSALVADEAKESELVGSLLGWKARLDEDVEACFARSEAFGNALKEGERGGDSGVGTRGVKG